MALRKSCSAGDEAVHAKAELVRSEYVIAVEGTVELRTPDTINPALADGRGGDRCREDLDSERIAHAAVPDGRYRRCQ